MALTPGQRATLRSFRVSGEGLINNAEATFARSKTSKLPLPRTLRTPDMPKGIRTGRLPGFPLRGRVSPSLAAPKAPRMV